MKWQEWEEQQKEVICKESNGVRKTIKDIKTLLMKTVKNDCKSNESTFLLLNLQEWDGKVFTKIGSTVKVSLQENYKKYTV